MCLPTRTEPVKVTRSASGSVIIASPIVKGLPVTTDSISGGSPASYSTSASASAVRGDVAGIDLAVVLDGELGRQRPDVVGAARLVVRILPAQAGLRRDEPGE